MEQEWLSFSEACSYCGIASKTLSKHVERGYVRALPRPGCLTLRNALVCLQDIFDRQSRAFDPTDNEAFVTVAEAAAATGVSLSKIYRAKRGGQLRFKQTGPREKASFRIYFPDVKRLADRSPTGLSQELDEAYFEELFDRFA